MLRYAIKRLLQLLPILLVIVCVNFFLVRLAPGDPVSYLIGDAPATPEFVAGLRSFYGLDKPVWEQLFIYLFNILHGDLGFSYVSQENVTTILLSRLPATLMLIGTELVLSIIIGVLAGVASARRQGKWLDQIVTVLSLIGYAVPAFWLAQILMLVFSLKLGLFPSQGMHSMRYDLSGWSSFTDLVYHLILPVFTLTIYNLALIARVTRASMANTMKLEFITFARSKGARERAVVWRHGLKNAILPVVTVIGLEFRNLVAGAVLTETVFAWPGVGRLTYDSIRSRDYPVLMGILLLIGVVVVIGNLLTDLAYARLDPRVRYQ
ncbi:MAG TPA: ABC transporter permease [Devosiaceae bacterium]|jgi:peptide/nickel transport system permease protein